MHNHLGSFLERRAFLRRGREVNEYVCLCMGMFVRANMCL